MTSFGPRKRNNKCRNKVCACDGLCFVDDGTGDFAKPTDPRIGLERLRSRILGWEDCDHEIKELESKLGEVEEILGLFFDAQKAFDHEDDVTQMLRFGEATQRMMAYFHRKANPTEIEGGKP